MSRILITGTGGFVGRGLAVALAEKHDVVGLDIVPHEIEGVTTLACDFSSADDLTQLNDTSFDVCVHMAAVTGFGTEEEQLSVNVLGTRLLVRYLVEKGCKKFVVNSSIAATGILGDEFVPKALPIPDDYPSQPLDGYGFSKYMMEELLRFICRNDESLDMLVVRSCGIRPEGERRDYPDSGHRVDCALAFISAMYISDAIDWITRAIEAPSKPGFRMMNSAGRTACLREPVADVMRAWYGDSLDLSAYEQPGHEYDPVLSTKGMQEELGFVAKTPFMDIER